MTTVLRKAIPKDFESIYPLLVKFHTAGSISKQTWKCLFETFWDPAEKTIGYLLLDESKPVGFLGTIYSCRLIGGKMERFCDLVAWIVDEKYRSESLRLLFPILEEKGLTITTFTASNRVIAVLRRLGFQDIEQDMQYILPIPSLQHKCKIITNKQEIRLELSGEEKRTFDQHADLHCEHVLLKAPQHSCYLILNKAIKKGVKVAMISYISERQNFARTIRQSVMTLCMKLKVVALVVGGHYQVGRIPFSIKAKRRHAILFRSDHLEPQNIDMIFSEIQILGLLPT